MADDELWEIERGFWLKGRAHYERHWSDEAIAGFPDPAGIMEGAGFVAGLPDEGSWSSVEMSDRTASRPRDDVAVLAYRADAASAERTYRCTCVSTYLREGHWIMIQHSQVPGTGA